MRESKFGGPMPSPSWFKEYAASARLQRSAGSVGALPSTEFAFRLFKELKPGSRNLVVCPYGARVVLAMLWQGSTGETRREMAEALRLDENSESHAHHYERLGRPLSFRLETERCGLEMLTANSLWCDEGCAPKPEYAKTLKEHYWAEIQTLRFCASDSAGKVNGWVREKTGGRIPSIVGSLEGLWPMVAMNAVYFKGQWMKPFETELTKEEEFAREDGKKEMVPMMRQSGKFGYEERGGAQIVRLPYKGRMTMCVVLPPKDANFSEFCSELSSTVGTRWTMAMGERDGHLRLPRFRMEATADLTAALRAMAMARVFDAGRATLERISNYKPFYLMAIMQKDFVEVNEKGTEAAAATCIKLGFEVPRPPPPPFEMIVNRPFIFAICDSFTGVIVFLGVVVDPLDSGAVKAEDLRRAKDAVLLVTS